MKILSNAGQYLWNLLRSLDFQYFWKRPRSLDFRKNHLKLNRWNTRLLIHCNIFCNNTALMVIHGSLILSLLYRTYLQMFRWNFISKFSCLFPNFFTYFILNFFSKALPCWPKKICRYIPIKYRYVCKI